MSTNHNRTKRAICALTSAAAAVPVALFVGAGTAKAAMQVFPSEPHPPAVLSAANQMAHIDIHGMPLDREWNVNVSCRNGESWQGNIHY